MNTGGPAFPLAASTGDPRDGVYCQNGMTLLDWMAGQALPWCLGEFAGNPEDGTQYAEAAYQIASAMLAEKARREAVVQESSTTDNAAKVAELQAANTAANREVERLRTEMYKFADSHVKLTVANRELVEALEACNAAFLKFAPQEESAYGAAWVKVRATISKHKGAA